MMVMVKQNGKLPFWKVFTTFFLLSQNALFARGVNAQNDETEGTTTEITINRAIEIGKLSLSLVSRFSPQAPIVLTAFLHLLLHIISFEKCKT